MQPIKSAYASSHDVEILSTETFGPFVLQKEKVQICTGDEATEFEIIYTADGNYIGLKDTAEYLIERGIVEQVQPAGGGQGTCSLGFNPVENKWYGWSHRAMFGFTIGSECKRGDCHYVPKDKEDTVERCKEFWEHGIPRTVTRDNGDVIVFTSLIENVQHDVERDGEIGFTYDYSCKGDNGEDIGRPNSFEAYPKPFGRGEWTAVTMEDAKTMAIHFAQSVS